MSSCSRLRREQVQARPEEGYGICRREYDRHFRHSGQYVASFISVIKVHRSLLLGTYTGHYEPVKEMSDLLDDYEKRTGNYVPIHGQYICFIAKGAPLTYRLSLQSMAPLEHSLLLSFM